MTLGLYFLVYFMISVRFVGLIYDLLWIFGIFLDSFLIFGYICGFVLDFLYIF